MKVKFGAKCPMCGQVYEIIFQTDRPYPKKAGGATMLHCEKCKTHPVLNFITTYDVDSVTQVKRYPLGETIVTKLVQTNKLVGVKH